MTPQLYDDTVADQHRSPATPRRSTRATGTASSGRSTPPRASRSGSSTRSPTAPSCGATRRSTAAAASGTRPPSTARGASSSPSPTRRRSTAPRSSRTGRAAPGPTSTRTRSSRSTARPESGSGSGRPSATTCATTTCRSPRSRRPCRSAASRPRSCWSPGRWARPSPTEPPTASISGRAPSASTRTTPGRCRASSSTIFPGDLGGVETPMALADNRLFVPWVDLPTRASATRPPGRAGGQPNFRKGRGGLTAVDAASGKVLWQHKLPSMDFGAATVANDVVFTSTYAGTVYAFDTQTGKTLWTTKAPAGINSFPAIDGDTLLVGAGTPDSTRSRSSSSSPTRSRRTTAEPRRSPRSDAARPRRRQPRRQRTTGQRGKEFSFKLSTKSISEARHASRSRSRTSATWCTTSRSTASGRRLIQPGKTAKLAVTFKKKGRYRYLCTVPGHAAAGMRGVFTVR